MVGHGLEFFPMGGDPKELMELCVKNDMFTPKFMKEALGSVRLVLTCVQRCSSSLVDLLLADFLLWFSSVAL